MTGYDFEVLNRKRKKIRTLYTNVKKFIFKKCKLGLK